MGLLSILIPYIDNDRVRKKDFVFYEKTNHSLLKRFSCWLFDEKLYPIDWEEVPPFDDYVHSHLIKHKVNSFIPVECVSQPDMVTQNMVYFRKFALFIVFCGFYKYLEKNQYRFSRVPLFGTTYYHSYIFRLMWLGYLYFVAEKSIVQRHKRLRMNN